MAGEQGHILIGTDGARFNADNFKLAIAEGKLPFLTATTAYETREDQVLRQVDEADYFIYEEGGAPSAPFFNTQGKAALREVRDGGRFVELPVAHAAPDGGVAHVFANLAPSPARSHGAYLRAGFDALPNAAVTFGGLLQLAGVNTRRTPEGLEVRYRWVCRKPPRSDYWCFTHVVDSCGRIAGYLDHRVLDGAPPMTTWQPGDSVFERLVLPSRLLDPGETYHLRVGLFQRESGVRLAITESALPLTDQGTAALVYEAEDPQPHRTHR